VGSPRISNGNLPVNEVLECSIVGSARRSAVRRSGELNRDSTLRPILGFSLHVSNGNDLDLIGRDLAIHKSVRKPAEQGPASSVYESPSLWIVDEVEYLGPNRVDKLGTEPRTMSFVPFCRIGELLLSSRMESA
jgi:hypothetical protein